MGRAGEDFGAATRSATGTNRSLAGYIIVGAIALALSIGACSSGAGDDAGTADTTDGATDAVGGSDEGEGDDASSGRARAAASDRSPVLDGGSVVSPDPAGPSAELRTLSDDPYVGVAVYPRPDYEADPWSQWGQGIVLDDGRVVTAIGDHLGVDGNSYLFVYEPETQTIRRFADVLSALDHEEGSWGYGKIHSQMVDSGTGGIFFTTYYGTRRGITFDGSYEGDALFRLDKTTLELQPVVVPVPRHGVPSLAGDGNGLIYGEAVDPLLDSDIYPQGGFFVFDTNSGEVTLYEEDPRHEGFRNMMVSPDGTAWFAGEEGSLFRYDPDTGSVDLSELELTAGLRASTVATDDGTIFGVTAEPWEFFAFEGSGDVRSLGESVEYATSLALLPDQSGFLYVPGAHGDAWKSGSPLISVDADSGEQTTIVELLEPVQQELGLVLGGTYSVTVDAERRYAHIGFNAGRTEDEPWGEVVFVVVELP